VKVRFTYETRSDVPAGTILGLEVGADVGRFTVGRSEDPHVFAWTSDMSAGRATLSQMLRAPLPDEAEMVARALERPRRDRLLDASLRAAARLVEKVAPRLSRRPPAG
jgi:hypothetical protein